jgi:hypothetical protein
MIIDYCGERVSTQKWLPGLWRTAFGLKLPRPALHSDAIPHSSAVYRSLRPDRSALDF